MGKFDAEKAAALFLAATFLVLAASAGSAYAQGGTLGDAIGFVRSFVRYLDETFFSPPAEDSFDAALINSAARADPALLLPAVERRSFFSPAMGAERNYTVLLPPHYYGTQERYPVLYLLHGRGGDDRSWIMKGRLAGIYGRLLAEGRVQEIIIAMPDSDNTAFANGCSGFIVFSCGNYEDYIIKDFTGEIDSAYRTLDDKEHRAIGGLSLGATGAMRLAFLHPDAFAAAFGHSGYYYPVIEEMADAGWARLKNSNITIYFDHARKDLIPGFFESSKALDKILSRKGIVHEFVAVDFPILGSHSWDLWRQQAAVSIERACGVICPASV